MNRAMVDLTGTEPHHVMCSRESSLTILAVLKTLTTFDAATRAAQQACGIVVRRSDTLEHLRTFL